MSGTLQQIMSVGARRNKWYLKWYLSYSSIIKSLGFASVGKQMKLDVIAFTIVTSIILGGCGAPRVKAERPVIDVPVPLDTAMEAIRNLAMEQDFLCDETHMVKKLIRIEISTYYHR